MSKNNGNATYLTLAVILASTVFAPSAVTLAHAQATPLVPKAAQSTNTGLTSSMKMSGMNMSAPSGSTKNLTVTRDSYCSSRR